jgi:iron complex transport system substrate-binding protein
MRRFLVLVLILTSNFVFCQSLRFASLSPSITEIFYEIGAEDSLIGVVAPDNYPQDTLKKEIIGSFNYLNFEKIYALKIDECLTIDGMQSNEDISRLKKMNVRVTIYKVENLEEMYKMILDIGEKTGNSKIVKKKIDCFKEKVGNLSKKIKEFKKGIFVVGLDPLVLVGKGSYLNDVMKKGGVLNVFENNPPSYFSPPLEFIIGKEIEIIIVLKGEIEERKISTFKGKLRPFFKHLKIIEVDADYVARPSLKLIEAIDEIYQGALN